MKAFIVDAFTDKAFAGNPAGVCLLEEPITESCMQAIATELGFSETAYVLGESIRFFSPKAEVPVCGHATLASAKVLFTTSHVEQHRFVNKNGVELFVRRLGDAVQMTFPLSPFEPASLAEEPLRALGITEAVETTYAPESKAYLVEIESTDDLANLRPNFAELEASISGINGIVVTARARDEYDFHLRYFWPWNGTNEDPVTGGIHRFLAPYWSAKLGKKRMHSFQSSARTGSMVVEITDGKLIIEGQAVIVFEGSILA